jgi:hypothetical protein
MTRSEAARSICLRAADKDRTDAPVVARLEGLESASTAAMQSAEGDTA